MLMIMMMIALMMIVFFALAKKQRPKKRGHLLDQLWAAKGEGAQYGPAPQANNTGQHHSPTILLYWPAPLASSTGQQ
jgi:hypothetical protein